MHPKLDAAWKIKPENSEFRNMVQETAIADNGRLKQRWVKRRAIPEGELWFENVWARFRKGEIYR